MKGAVPGMVTLNGGRQRNEVQYDELEHKEDEVGGRENKNVVNADEEVESRVHVLVGYEIQLRCRRTQIGCGCGCGCGGSLCSYFGTRSTCMYINK